MKKKSTFIRIFSFMGKKIYKYIFGLLGLSVIVLLVQVFISFLFKDMFNAIADNKLNEMIISVRNYGILILIAFILFPILEYIIQKTVVLTTGNIRKAVFSKLERLPILYFKNTHSGDLVSRMTNDTSEMERVYSDLFADFVVATITGLGTFIFTIFLDWRLAIVTLISGLITLYVNLNFSKILRVLSTNIQEKLARLNENLINILDGVHVIRSFNLHNTIMKKYKTKNNDVYDASIERVKTQSVIDGLNAIAGFLSFSGVITVGSYLYIKGLMPSLGIIIASVQLQNGVRNFVLTLGTFISQMQSSLASSDRVFEVLDSEDEPEKYDLSINETTTSPYLIEMKDITFNYGEENVLNKLSLSVPSGNVYAVVGPSGGGKSTLFKLILNFFKPNSGNLLINGQSISEQKIKDIRSIISYVPQDAYLFTGSIADNIRHGNKNATMEDIIEAAKNANAHDFIMEMEKGYDTLVGERGTQLSGGQRQRIAIARAILKNAPILLLDEATSALDTESEILVQGALYKLMEGKTTLVIAHRLSTIQNANQILVLKDGCIVEKGNHDELLSIDGVYKQLYNKQFAFVA